MKSLFTLFSLLLVGCGSQDAANSARSELNEPAHSPAAVTVSPEEALNQYASKIVAENAADFSGHEPAYVPSTGRPPTYVIVFHTIGTAYLTRKNISDSDVAAYNKNLEITSRWQKIYCTPELKQIMRTHGMLGAHSHIQDSKGEKHSMAICTV